MLAVPACSCHELVPSGPACAELQLLEARRVITLPLAPAHPTTSFHTNPALCPQSRMASSQELQAEEDRIYAEWMAQAQEAAQAARAAYHERRRAQLLEVGWWVWGKGLMQVVEFDLMQLEGERQALGILNPSDAMSIAHCSCLVHFFHRCRRRALWSRSGAAPPCSRLCLRSRRTACMAGPRVCLRPVSAVDFFAAGDDVLLLLRCVALLLYCLCCCW